MYYQEYDETLTNNTHYKVGKVLKKTIRNLGGNIPEELPTQKKSLKKQKKKK